MDIDFTMSSDVKVGVNIKKIFLSSKKHVLDNYQKFVYILAQFQVITIDSF